MIRLRRADSHERVGTVREGITYEEFQFACLIAAQRKPGLIVALDEQVRSAELVRQPGECFNRRRKLREREARQLINMHGCMDSTGFSVFCKRFHFRQLPHASHKFTSNGDTLSLRQMRASGNGRFKSVTGSTTTLSGHRQVAPLTNATPSLH